MNESQISVRYAKALFQSASEKKILDEVFRDMELLTETCRIDEFQYLLVQPSLQASKKCNMVESLLEKHLTGISLSMVELVIRNKRETYLPGIARNYKDLYRKAKGIRSATLVTAYPVEEAEIEKLRKLIRQTFKEEVELTKRLDEEIIGGFVLTIEDMQYDASVARNLRKMKNQLLQTSIEK
jgi:F-type H+-transporting ATPase subunit delta